MARHLWKMRGLLGPESHEIYDEMHGPDSPEKIAASVKLPVSCVWDVAYYWQVNWDARRRRWWYDPRPKTWRKHRRIQRSLERMERAVRRRKQDSTQIPEGQE